MWIVGITAVLFGACYVAIMTQRFRGDAQDALVYGLGLALLLFVLGWSMLKRSRDVLKDPGER